MKTVTRKALQILTEKTLIFFNPLYYFSLDLVRFV